MNCSVALCAALSLLYVGAASAQNDGRRSPTTDRAMRLERPPAHAGSQYSRMRAAQGATSRYDYRALEQGVPSNWSRNLNRRYGSPFHWEMRPAATRDSPGYANATRSIAAIPSVAPTDAATTSTMNPIARSELIAGNGTSTGTNAPAGANAALGDANAPANLNDSTQTGTSRQAGTEPLNPGRDSRGWFNTSERHPPRDNPTSHARNNRWPNGNRHYTSYSTERSRGYFGSYSSTSARKGRPPEEPK